ncbi:MAG: Asp-tRNA(Asn)/Glu-tRNA(Gln) amidotransferase subunit GatB [Planctomycetota bacterium]
MERKIIVGLEIHVQLDTRTKMFCGCGVEFGAAPNSRTCPVCLGMPGSLPVMNRQAVERAILAAMALNCDIARFTKWDRKSYYYPDLPKNYQISQYDLPLGSNGYIEIPTHGAEKKKVRIKRVHLEEDAGKNLHDAGNFSKVDLNRAGTPLLEIVTEPDLNAAGEVRALAEELQRIVRYLNVSKGDMQKGHMRFEPNINLALGEGGAEYKTPIAEIKNLNSFRALESSVAFEARRQLDEFLETHVTFEKGNKSTRGWDDGRQRTVLQREKEEAEEYRYFPDPDLVPVELDEAWLKRIETRLCELPLQRQSRYVREYQLSDYDAGVLTAERSLSDYFDQAVDAGSAPKRLCNLVTQSGLKLAKEQACSFVELRVSAERMARLVGMVESGDVGATAADKILEEMTRCEERPEAIARRLNLLQQSDESQLEDIVKTVIAENPETVEIAASGQKKAKKAFGYLMGQVMKKTGGTANPKIASGILKTRIG